MQRVSRVHYRHLECVLRSSRTLSREGWMGGKKRKSWKQNSRDKRGPNYVLLHGKQVYSAVATAPRNRIGAGGERSPIASACTEHGVPSILISLPASTGGLPLFTPTHGSGCGPRAEHGQTGIESPRRCKWQLIHG